MFLFENGTGQLLLVDHDLADPGPLSRTEGDAEAEQPVISADGKFVAFRSKSTNLVSGTGPTGSRGFFLWKRQDGSITLLSTCAGGPYPCYASGSSAHPVINADGSFVAFESLANDLDTRDSNTSSDVFR